MLAWRAWNGAGVMAICDVTGLRLSQDGAADAEPALSWSRFWAVDGGLLEHGIARNAGREFLERCLEYAPNTVMGAAVDHYLAKWFPGRV